MNTTHYYLQMGPCNSLQSRVHKDVYKFLKSLDGKLIEFLELKKFKEKVTEEIEKINARHHRCKPAVINFRCFDHRKETILIDGIPGLTFYICPSTHIHISSIKNYN